MAKWMTSALIVAAMAACGGKGKGPATGMMNSGPSTTPVPAPHYAALFNDGATWTYDLVSTATGGDGPDDKTETKGTATCKVASTGKVDGGVTSTITCDTPVVESGGDPLAGIWVANADGLYKFETELTTPLDMSKGRLVIAAAPVEGHKEKETGQDPVESESWQVTRSGDAWCAAYTMAAGDEAFETLCFGAAGVVKGSGGWAGGSVHETNFVLRK